MRFEFESLELSEFEMKIRKESKSLIEKIIKEHSPIQIGDIVNELKVIRVRLYGIDCWGSPFSKMSFSYEGIPLKKDGTPIKNRKPIWFSSFEKDGNRIEMPSYLRKEIVPATVVLKRVF